MFIEMSPPIVDEIHNVVTETVSQELNDFCKSTVAKYSNCI